MSFAGLIESVCLFILIGPAWVTGPPLVSGGEINPIQTMWAENGIVVLLQGEAMGSVTHKRRTLGRQTPRMTNM